jgi:hypothetical protein
MQAPDDDNGGWVRPKEVGLFKEVTSSETVSGHHFQSKLELIEEQALIEVLEPTPRKAKAKEAEVFHKRQIA